MLRIPWDLDEARGDAGSNMPQLIKMHGCVTEPDSIVITREDYMRYADNNGALRGLLSEMLMQRELVWWRHTPSNAPSYCRRWLRTFAHT